MGLGARLDVLKARIRSTLVITAVDHTPGASHKLARLFHHATQGLFPPEMVIALDPSESSTPSGVLPASSEAQVAGDLEQLVQQAC